jgi:hypothetical protein
MSRGFARQPPRGVTQEAPQEGDFFGIENAHVCFVVGAAQKGDTK